MKPSYANLNSEGRLHLLVGMAVRHDRMNKQSLWTFAHTTSMKHLFEHDFVEVAENARAKVQLGDVGTDTTDRIDAEAAEAMLGAIEFAVRAHERGRWLIESDWTPEGDTETDYVNAGPHVDPLPDRPELHASLADLEKVVEDLGLAFRRLFSLRFLTGDFFSENRERYLRMARGEELLP